ncbi:Scr1 family TA system antitoxin-like transcriptional regulator [Actinosynnema sp. NPDC004786]
MKGTPTLRGRLLGLELRQAREAANLAVTELAAQAQWPPGRVRQLEAGVSESWPADLIPYRTVVGHRWNRLADLAQRVDEPEMWCEWGTEADSVLDVLFQDAERIDLFAPLGIHPALRRPAARCTAYVLDCAVVDNANVTVRVIPQDAGAYPGIDYHPLTYFRLPDGPAVVLYAYLHAAQFTQETPHLLQAYTLFERLDEFVVAMDER